MKSVVQQSHKELQPHDSLEAQSPTAQQCRDKNRLTTSHPINKHPQPASSLQISSHHLTQCNHANHTQWKPTRLHYTLTNRTKPVAISCNPAAAVLRGSS